MWPLFTTTAIYATNTFVSKALNDFSPFQLVFVRDPPDLTSLSFSKIDTIPVAYGEYCSIMLHVNCKIAVFQECSSTYHGKDRHKG